MPPKYWKCRQPKCGELNHWHFEWCWACCGPFQELKPKAKAVPRSHVVTPTKTEIAAPVIKEEPPPQASVHDISSDAMSDVPVSTSEDKFAVDLADMSLEDLRAELKSLSRQMQAVADLEDPRSIKLKAFLQSEMNQVKHSITKLKPPSER
eukprot:12413825-Karenia_brevis.AAC.1